MSPPRRPAPSNTERFQPGIGGLDTLEVCPIIGVQTVQGTATIFTSRFRPGPRHVLIIVDLERDGEQIQISNPRCQAGPLRADDRFVSRMALAGNVSGPQGYHSFAYAVVDGVGTVVYTPVSVG